MRDRLEVRDGARRTEDLDQLPATVSVEEAGALLGLSRRSAYRAMERGELPVLRFGRRLLVPSAKLLVLLGLRPNSASTACATPTPAAPARGRQPQGRLGATRPQLGRLHARHLRTRHAGHAARSCRALLRAVLAPLDPDDPLARPDGGEGRDAQEEET